MNEELRTKNNHCSSCNQGSYLDGTDCHMYEYTCTTGALLTECKTCIDQVILTDNNQCQSCNDGAILDGARCTSNLTDTLVDSSLMTTGEVVASSVSAVIFVLLLGGTIGVITYLSKEEKWESVMDPNAAGISFARSLETTGSFSAFVMCLLVPDRLTSPEQRLRGRLLASVLSGKNNFDYFVFAALLATFILGMFLFVTSVCRAISQDNSSRNFPRLKDFVRRKGVLHAEVVLDFLLAVVIICTAVILFTDQHYGFILPGICSGLVVLKLLMLIFSARGAIYTGDKKMSTICQEERHPNESKFSRRRSSVKIPTEIVVGTPVSNGGKKISKVGRKYAKDNNRLTTVQLVDARGSSKRDISIDDLRNVSLIPSLNKTRAPKQVKKAPPPVPPSKPSCVTAMFSYKKIEHDELSFKKGDKITIRRICEEGWGYGTHNRSGINGMFPLNFTSYSARANTK